MPIASTADQAVSSICSGQRVFVQGGVATPEVLLQALYERRKELSDVELIHIHLEGKLPYQKEGFSKSFHVTSLFTGENVRPLLNYEEIDYLPCFLSEIPLLFLEKIRPLDVALIHVSPPDKHGFCSLGTSVDITKAAIDTAPVIIAQINKNMPRVHGDGCIHISKIHYSVEHDSPIIEQRSSPLSEEEKKIGAHIAEMVEDGSTLQIGIGKIPNAVLATLKNHKNLGVHTEVWSDALLPLLETGAVNNTKKIIHPGKTVSSFVIGTKKLYDFIDDNPSILQLDIAFTNKPEIIGKNPNVVAVNSAVEIDLTGQICADSVGTRIISGIGGQIDFMRGASLSRNGKAIIAIASRTSDGTSKIVNTLKHGAGVTTTRAHVQYVATEYGVVNLKGKTLHERARALISIAHPGDREDLERQWKERGRHI